MHSPLEWLKQAAGEQEYETGAQIFLRGRVSARPSKGSVLQYAVDDSPRRIVQFQMSENPTCRCSCDFYMVHRDPCKHIVAAMMQAVKDGKAGDMISAQARQDGMTLLRLVESQPLYESIVNLDIVIRRQGDMFEPELSVQMRVGQDRMYVVRDIPRFLDEIRSSKKIEFGKCFTFSPQWMRFSSLDKRILDIMWEIISAMRISGDAKLPFNPRTLPLPGPWGARVMRLLLKRPFRLAVPGRLMDIAKISNEQLPLVFAFDAEDDDIIMNSGLPSFILPITEDCEFVMCNENIWRVNKYQRAILAHLMRFSSNGRAAFRFDKGLAERAISELLPQIERAGKLTLSDEVERRVVRYPLKSKVYLDRAGNDIMARVIFCYGDIEVDPFSPAVARDEDMPILVRDQGSEHKLLEILAKSGFNVRLGAVYLSGSKEIYEFLTYGVSEIMQAAEVYLSEEFKRMTPRRPMLRGVMKKSGSGLRLDMLEGDMPIEEVRPLIEALAARRKYFRLKDGSFLHLSEYGEWQEFAAEITQNALPMRDTNVISVAPYRAMYLNSLLSQSEISVEQDASMRGLTGALESNGDPCPQPLDKILRPYQQKGFQWIQALYQLKMGGVLADDMGLGKTIQVIAALLWGKRKFGQQCALVVSPTSLTYNWAAELARFAPELKVEVISGGQRARAAQFEELTGDNTTDVIITSYPLLRRDIDQIENIEFRFLILDEAQQIKNASSVGAEAARRLTAHTRIALTGTPMENHLGELWSIFEAVLPGYLHSQSDFMAKYGSGQNRESLRAKLRPFLLRRIKSEVLLELPEKIEGRVLAEMTSEQAAVYAASLMRAKERIESMSGGRGQIEALAAITELRQVCCHPVLCLEQYSDGSGKLDALMEILPSAVAAGHRLLLFSQFTSMLAILLKCIEAEGITTLYLDGKTPASERMELVDRFNEGEGDVFLISLKAGGAGLNLTGADMVIHYDPWWNPAAEDQATDRAHRIGQTRSVQVIRLLTRGTIEERVAELSLQKRAAFDSIITAGETIPTQMTAEDIKSLFKDIT